MSSIEKIINEARIRFNLEAARGYFKTGQFEVALFHIRRAQTIRAEMSSS